jgi:excisionase family DNA binding protein
MIGRLLTARELGDLLHVSPETILRWHRAGELPALRLPSGAIRFRPAEIEAWLTERATSSARRRARRAADELEPASPPKPPELAFQHHP